MKFFKRFLLEIIKPEKSGSLICGNKNFSRVCCLSKWLFPKIVVPQNEWFILENPMKMDDLGIPLFLETPKSPLLLAR